MAEKNQGLVILVIVLICVCIGLAGGGYFLLQKEKAEVLKLTDQVKDWQKKHSLVVFELDEKKTEIAGLETRLQEANGKVTSLTSSLDKEKSARSQLARQLEESKAQLEQQLALKTEMEQKLVRSESTLQEVDKRLKQMEAQLKAAEKGKAELEQKLKSLESRGQSGVELGTIVVSPEAPAKKPAEPAKAAVKALEGRVLVVNKDFNFAVINLGSKDGVQVGQVFSVLHNKAAVGTITVEKVHESMAAAGFAAPELKDKVVEGDTVVQNVH